MDFRSVCLLACLTIDVFFAICTDDAKFATEKSLWKGKRPCQSRERGSSMGRKG